MSASFAQPVKGVMPCDGSQMSGQSPVVLAVITALWHCASAQSDSQSPLLHHCMSVRSSGPFLKLDHIVHDHDRRALNAGASTPSHPAYSLSVT